MGIQTATKKIYKKIIFLFWLRRWIRIRLKSIRIRSLCPHCSNALSVGEIPERIQPRLERKLERGAPRHESVDQLVVGGEDLGDGQAAAEGATLGNWTYQQFKSKKKDFPMASQ